jgi:hypothetical protein
MNPFHGSFAKPWTSRICSEPGFTRRGDRMSFGIYAAGFAILIGGLVYAAHLMHIPSHWIAAGAVILFGIGILSAVRATRQKDLSK